MDARGRHSAPEHLPTAPEGPAQDGPAQDGPAQDGPAQDGPEPRFGRSPTVQVRPQVAGAGLVGLGVPLPPAQLPSRVKADLMRPVLRSLPDGSYSSVRFGPKRMPTAYRGYP